MEAQTSFTLHLTPQPVFSQWSFLHLFLVTSISFQLISVKQLLIKEKASFAKTWKMCTLAAVFVGEGSHDLQSANSRFTCCTGGAVKRLTPPPQIITAFSHHWPIHGYGERRRTKSPGWHLTSNSFKAGNMASFRCWLFSEMTAAVRSLLFHGLQER